MIDPSEKPENPAVAAFRASQHAAAQARRKWMRWIFGIVASGVVIVFLVLSNSGKMNRELPIAQSSQEEGGSVAPAPLKTEQESGSGSVRILSAIYGTRGKHADVTEKVKQLVEVQRRDFVVTPRDLGEDPIPGWNKLLHIVYMKDGVRRELKRWENNKFHCEGFYSPHDAPELSTWLEGTRWKAAGGELHFHANGKIEGSAISTTATWEALGATSLRISCPDSEDKLAGLYDVWRGFRHLQLKDGKFTYRLMESPL